MSQPAPTKVPSSASISAIMRRPWRIARNGSQFGSRQRKARWSDTHGHGRLGWLDARLVDTKTEPVLEAGSQLGRWRVAGIDNLSEESV